MQSGEKTKQYLGDGVYAEFDGYQIWLKTEREGGIWHEIALDPGVLTKFAGYLQDLQDGKFE